MNADLEVELAGKQKHALCDNNSARRNDKRSFISSAVGTSIAEAFTYHGVGKLSANLFKLLAGSGIMLVPRCAVYAGGHRLSVIPALAALFLTGVLNAWTWWLIAKVSIAVKETTYEGTWLKVALPGKRWPRWITVAIVVGNAHAVCFRCLVIAVESLSSFLQYCQVPRVFFHGDFVMIVLVVAVLFPISWAKDLAGLANFSMVGLAANFYVVIAVLIASMNGRYQNRAVFEENFRIDGSIMGAIAIMISIYSAHYDPALYWDQMEPAADGSKSCRFVSLIGIAFGGASGLYAISMVAGFLTFGTRADILILENYDHDDPMMIGARLAMAVSVLMTFAIAFFNLRRQVLSALGYNIDDGSRSGETYDWWVITCVLLGEITCAAILLYNHLAVTLKICGAVFANMLMYICPAIMALRAVHLGFISPDEWGFGRWGRIGQMCLVPFGVLVTFGTLYGLFKGTN